MIHLPLIERRWSPLDDQKFGLMNTFSENLKQVEAMHPDLFPDLRDGSTMFIGSDFSGQHKLARYETLSFLFADIEKCNEWENMRQELRKKYLSDGRRMSYKNLRDSKKRNILIHFLDAADNIPGLLFTILIDKEIGSLFTFKNHIDMNSPEYIKFKHWKRNSFEKLLRVIHFVSCFLNGLSRENQDVIWFIDEDDIVPNDDRLKEFVKIFGQIGSHYLKHNLGNIRIGTTKSDTGRRDIEDLVSVTDIAAGALCQVLTDYSKNGVVPGSRILTPLTHPLPSKTKEIALWLSDSNQRLKKIVYEIKKDNNSTKLNLNYWRFHGLINYNL
jgi:hypothetical protein